MRNLSRLAAEGATVATWSVAAEVRKALEETGFAVAKRPGFGHKREMLAGSSTRGKRAPAVQRKAAVVGAGLAGAALCERLCARGWEVELHERHAGAPISHDDLLDFHALLEDEASLALALDTLLDR